MAGWTQQAQMPLPTWSLAVTCANEHSTRDVAVGSEPASAHKQDPLLCPSLCGFSDHRAWGLQPSQLQMPLLSQKHTYPRHLVCDLI